MAGYPTTIDGMAEKVLRQITAYYRHEYGTLAASAAASAGSLVLGTGHADALGLQIGDVIETKAELHLITAISTDTLTVSNAYAGTTAAAYVTGDIVRVMPRIGRQDVYEAMESVVLSWDDLFAVNRYTASASFQTAGSRSAEVSGAPEDYIAVVKTLFETDEDVWVPPPKEWFVRDIPSVGSGMLLQWEEPFYQGNSGTKTVSVWLSEYFDTSVWDADTDLVSDIGLSRGMLPVLYFGTMFTCLMPEETQRADFDSQPQPREAQEVPPGHLAQTAMSFKALHDSRKQIEAAKLQKRWAR